MSRLQNNLGRGLGDLIGEVSQVRAVPTRAPAPAPTSPPPPAAPTPRSPAPPARSNGRAVLWSLAIALVLALAGCLVLAWRLREAQATGPAIPPEPTLAELAALPPPATEPLAPLPPPADTRLDWAQGLQVPGARVEPSESSVRIVFNEGVFKSRDQLQPEAAQTLRRLAVTFAPQAASCVLVVVGHTDDEKPRAGGTYRDNTAMGYARALAAGEVLRAAGVPADALRLASAGEVNPPFPHADPANKPRNRTVTLLIEKRP